MNSELQINDTFSDPLKLSKKWLVVVMFFQSPSTNYKEVISIARGASCFQQVLIENKPINLVCFDKSTADIARFKTIHPLIAGWKSTRFFAGGRVLSESYSIYLTLNCYSLSLACTNYEAHCWQVVPHPYHQEAFRRDIGISISLEFPEDKVGYKMPPITPPPLLLNPCKRLDNRYRFSKHHPASLIEQIQAYSVEENVDWCPNFKPYETKEIKGY